MSSEIADECHSNLGPVEATIRSGINPGYTTKKGGHWDAWLLYWDTVKIDPFFSDLVDPISYLQVFVHRYRDGRLAARGKRV